MKTEKIISKNLSWLNTIKKDNGYGGPVIHYWQNSLSYIGPSLDWGYEGIITAFITLYEKTENNKFLNLALEAGNHLAKNQFINGSFLNSNFEANPSLTMGGTPHESAACIGLARLCLKLKELKMDYKIYLNTLMNNFNKFHMKILYDKNEKTFLQYRYDPKKYHVPNKIATISELCLLLHKLTGQNIYERLAINNANFISHCIDKKNGGLYQTDKNNIRIITYYNARCIPFLKEINKKTNKYEKPLYAAYEFIKSMECKEGGFNFGLINKNGKMEKVKYPQFAAGTADIIRALKLVDEKKHNHHIEWLLDKRNPNGSFRTSVGILNKDTNNKPELSWKDVMPVFGWNDKVLRLYAELLKSNKEIEINEISPMEIDCTDGKYYEDKKKILIKNSIVFKKNEYFAKNNYILKPLMNATNIYASFRKRYGIDIRTMRYFFNKFGGYKHTL